MGKKSFNTLFSRMLSTYLAIILLIIFLLGITISGMFKSQYMTENENELRREAAEINRVIVTQYVDAEKRAVAKDTLCLLYTSSSEVIDNSSSIGTLYEQIDALYKQYAGAGANA